MAILVTAARPDAPKGGDGDAKAVQGTWVMESGEIGGKAFPPEAAKSIRLVLTDGKYVLTGAEQPDEGTVKMDPTKSPKEFDIVGTKGPNMGKTILAIYELKGDTLRVCYDLSGKEHPKEFKAAAGSRLFLATYHRDKR
jgi:uncharacterized protein (TIGR03067 family)